MSEIYAALASAQGEFPEIVKRRTATVKSDKGTYKYNYADLSDILASIRPVLAKHKLSISQPIEAAETGRLLLHTILAHASGETIQATMPLAAFPADGRQVQSWAGVLTYARRYNLTAVLGIAAEEDDDANGAADHGSTTITERPKPQPVPRGTPEQEANAAIARSQPAEEPMLEVVKIIEGTKAFYTGSIFSEALRAYATVKGRAVNKPSVARANLDALKVLRDHATGNNATKLAQEIEAAEALTSEAA
jgi:hypothetical protein